MSLLCLVILLWSYTGSFFMPPFAMLCNIWKDQKSLLGAWIPLNYSEICIPKSRITDCHIPSQQSAYLKKHLLGKKLDFFQPITKC